MRRFLGPSLKLFQVKNGNMCGRSLQVAVGKRYYFPDGELMKRTEGKYYSDPREVAERVIRVVGLHDNVKDPSQIRANSQLNQLGFNSLDVVEICLMIEREFDIEFSEDQAEIFFTISDIVESVATNFYAK